LTSQSFETQYLKIKWSEQGIHSWFDKVNQKELIRTDKNHALFTPVYEITKLTIREKIGRNRKGIDVIRCSGNLVQVILSESGKNLVTLKLTYKLEGITEYIIYFLG